MTDLSRNLLSAAREGLAPDAATTARVRARVASAVAPPAAAGGSGALLKLAALGVVAAVIATGFVIPRSPQPAAPKLLVHAVEADEPATQLAPMASREAPAPAARSVLTREPVSLAREVELIDNAMEALRGGEPRQALATLVMFERETLGHAQLAEDAAAIDLEARCALGENVSTRLSAFDAKWSSSAQRTRIAGACR